jgi:hypothetical protein
VGIGLLIAFGAMQFIQPGRENPPADTQAAIAAHIDPSSKLVGVLDRSCNACHSNSTVWPWYTEIAPVSWIAVNGVERARQSVNFSEWGRYSRAQRRQLLQASCVAATTGRMPGDFFTSLEPRARLSAADIITICDAANAGVPVASDEQL